MKKKRFYKNKKRNTKWTEEPQGRKISFADKYATDGTASSERATRKGFTKAQRDKLLRRIIIAVLCFAVISVGYIVTDIHMIRNSMPQASAEDDNTGVKLVELSIKAGEVQPLSFDAGTMLESVIKEEASLGYTSVCFDLKRDDGTVGYQSLLATISAYGAISSPATDLKGSVEMFIQNDILPVARISVYKDNIAARADTANAVMIDGGIYEDSNGTAYLNPDSEGTYNYIKGIIEEAKGMGINVFVLDNYDLPSDISDNFNDGFDAISKKLYADFGDEIKLVKSVSVSVDSAEYEAIEDQLSSFEKKEGEVLYTYAEYPDRVKTVYDNMDVNYIISAK